jgi:tetratricopeptide (TPR) repeat protein
MKSGKGMGILVVAGLLVFPKAVPAQTEEAARIFSQNSPGAVTLIVYGEDKQELAKGTAFAVAEDVVAASYHLVGRAFDAEVVTAKGKKIKIEGIVTVSKPYDIVFLKLKGKIQALAAGGPEGLVQGARIFAIGANETGQLMPSEGTIRKFLELAPDQKFMEVSLAIPDSFTGGPVFDLNGKVVGMVQVMGKGLRCVLPSNLFQNLPRAGKIILLKDSAREDYFSSLEGAYLAGRLAAMIDDLAAARAHLETAIKLDPSLIVAYSLLADVYSAQRDYNAAVTAYNKVIELDANRVDALHRLGSLYLRMQRFNDAIGPLERAVALDPNRKEAYNDLGTAHEETKDFAQAAEAYEKYIRLKPENPWSGYLRLGLCRMETNELDAAVSALQEAQKLQPNDVKTNFKLAEAYARSRRMDEAEATYKALSGINPEGATTYYGKIITMYDEAGQYDKAIEAARKIIEFNPGNELAFFNLGIMFLKLKRYDEAVGAFKDALALKPGYASALYNIGYSYSLAKKYKEAVEGFQKYVEFMPEDPVGWLNIGVAYMMIKNFEAALEPLRKSIELKPDNAVAHYNLAIVYLNLKDTYSATEVYKTLLGLNPELAGKLKKLLR